jgi:predicted ABC-type transport system involved in lysophospholipase L1 biosynthesis ATPase subunit
VSSTWVGVAGLTIRRSDLTTRFALTKYNSTLSYKTSTTDVVVLSGVVSTVVVGSSVEVVAESASGTSWGLSGTKRPSSGTPHATPTKAVDVAKRIAQTRR